jgi:hypothetical protein
MMKLTDAEKFARKSMLYDLRLEGGKIFQDSFSGLTVCVKPACNVPNPKFFYISTAQCDFVDDGFKRKRGEFVALNKMLFDMYCTVPANDRSIDEMGVDAVDFFAMD